MSTQAPVLTSTGTTRGQHLRVILRGPAWSITTAALALGGLVVGAATGIATVAIAALVGVPVVALIVAFVIASGRATQDFWTTYAASLGLVYVGETELPELSPILAAGDRRSCTDWMHGTTEDGWPVGLGNYTYQTQQRDSDGSGYHYEDSDFTVATIQVAEPDACFLRAVSLRDHHRNALTRFFSADAVDTFQSELLRTESVAFDQRYDLSIAEGEDKVRVLEVFTPAFLDRLAEHPLRPYLDYRAGTLVVFIEGHSDEATELTALLNCAREITGRFREEIAESVRAGQSPAPR